MMPSATGAVTTPEPHPASAATPAVTRVLSIDVFRGFVMFLMLAEAMQLWTVREAFPASRFWGWVAFNTTHVPWQGCSLHDSSADVLDVRGHAHTDRARVHLSLPDGVRTGSRAGGRIRRDPRGLLGRVRALPAAPCGL